MKRLFGQWQRLNWGEKAIFIEAAFLLYLIRAALWIVPFSALRRFAERGAIPARPPDAVRDRDRFACARAVHCLARYVPQATCLTQSLAVFLLLKHHRDPVCLQIGVAKGDRGQLLAHAWVETPDGTRLTATGGDGYVPLVRF